MPMQTNEARQSPEGEDVASPMSARMASQSDKEPALEEGATGRAEGLNRRGVDVDAIERAEARQSPEGEDAAA